MIFNKYKYFSAFLVYKTCVFILYFYHFRGICIKTMVLPLLIGDNFFSEIFNLSHRQTIYGYSIAAIPQETKITWDLFSWEIYLGCVFTAWEKAMKSTSLKIFPSCDKVFPNALFRQCVQVERNKENAKKTN